MISMTGTYLLSTLQYNNPCIVYTDYTVITLLLGMILTFYIFKAVASSFDLISHFSDVEKHWTAHKIYFVPGSDVTAA